MRGELWQILQPWSVFLPHFWPLCSNLQPRTASWATPPQHKFQPSSQEPFSSTLWAESPEWAERSFFCCLSYGNVVECWGCLLLKLTKIQQFVHECPKSCRYLFVSTIPLPCPFHYLRLSSFLYDSQWPHSLSSLMAVMSTVNKE